MYQKRTNEVIVGSIAVQKVILLIDDDEDEHEIFMSALMNIDNALDFIGAKSCEEGLGILKELQPDYIFVDVNMPRINGITCLQEIKKIARIKHVPVYMYSTGMNARDGETALQFGAVDYLIKPSSISTLSALLRKILYQSPFN